MKLSLHRAIVTSVVLCCAFALGLSRTATSAQEHPGREHPGREHPGREHPGKEYPEQPKKGVIPARELTGQEIHDGIQEHIDKKLKANNNLFPITDNVTKQKLNLQFVKVHDDKVSIISPKKKGETKTYFACTDFKEPAAGTAYDIDFWMKLQPNGKLKVVDTRIHKVDGQPRYTYKNDEIVDIKLNEKG
jgi:hypothetical protein